jgi:hypothetical protein
MSSLVVLNEPSGLLAPRGVGVGVVVLGVFHAIEALARDFRLRAGEQADPVVAGREFYSNWEDQS